MTITAVGTQEGGAYVDSSSTATRAFGSNVAANNVAVFGAARYTTTSKPFADVNCTKSAGTATIGSPVLANSGEINPGTNVYVQVGIWMVPITGAGSLTLQIAGGDTASYWSVASGEYHNDTTPDSWSVEAAPTGATGTSNAAATSNATSAGAALFWGVCGSAQGNTDSIAIQSPYTDIFHGNDGLNHQAADFARHIVATGTTEAINWNLGGTNAWNAISAVIKAVISAPAANIVRQMMAHEGG